MRPTLLEIGGLQFHAYPTMLAIAFLLCTLGMVRDLQRRTPPISLDPVVGVWALLGAMIGARAYCILQYGEIQDVWQAIFFWERGLVFYGGLIGGVLTVYVYLRWKRIPAVPVSDATAPYLALGEAITRIGCFLNGCCWGDVTHLPWGVHFPAGSLPYNQQLLDQIIQPTALTSAPVHPTQLYMTIGLLVVFAILKTLAHRTTIPGMLVAGYGIGYGILRFCVEGLRGDSARSVLGMTISQTISLGFVLAGFVVVVWMLATKKRQKRDTEEERFTTE